MAARPIRACRDILTPEQLAARLQVRVSWVYEKSRARAAIMGMRCQSCAVGVTCASDWPDVCEWLRDVKQST